eukprot:g36773.t1
MGTPSCVHALDEGEDGVQQQSLFLRRFRPRYSSSDSDSDMGGMYWTVAHLLHLEHLRRSPSSSGGNDIKAASISDSEVSSIPDTGGEPLVSDRPSGYLEGPDVIPEFAKQTFGMSKHFEWASAMTRNIEPMKGLALPTYNRVHGLPGYSQECGGTT